MQGISQTLGDSFLSLSCPQLPVFLTCLSLTCDLKNLSQLMSQTAASCLCGFSAHLSSDEGHKQIQYSLQLDLYEITRLEDVCSVFVSSGCTWKYHALTSLFTDGEQKIGALFVLLLLILHSCRALTPSFIGKGKGRVCFSF